MISCRSTEMTVSEWIAGMECVWMAQTNLAVSVTQAFNTGELCQPDIDDCVGVDCGMNGQCEDGVNSFECVCDSGFAREFCQINIDDCAVVNCSGNGICLDRVNSFTCECITGYNIISLREIKLHKTGRPNLTIMRMQNFIAACAVALSFM